MLVLFLLGLGLALVVVLGRVAVRRRRGVVLEDLTGLPSRLRDPETGELL